MALLHGRRLGSEKPAESTKQSQQSVISVFMVLSPPSNSIAQPGSNPRHRRNSTDRRPTFPSDSSPLDEAATVFQPALHLRPDGPGCQFRCFMRFEPERKTWLGQTPELDPQTAVTRQAGYLPSMSLDSRVLAHIEEFGNLIVAAPLPPVLYHSVIQGIRAHDQPSLLSRSASSYFHGPASSIF